MKRYRFVKGYTVKDAEGCVYKKGQVVELSEASARHFSRKNLIIEVRATKAKKTLKSPRLVGKHGPEIIVPIIVEQKAGKGAKT